MSEGSQPARREESEGAAPRRAATRQHAVHRYLRWRDSHAQGGAGLRFGGRGAGDVTDSTRAQPGLRRRIPAGSGVDAREDSRIRDAVHQTLSADTYVDLKDIDIRVEAGIVTLQGHVADSIQARYACDDAWDTPGVRGVVSQLTVRRDERSSSEDRAGGR